MERAREAGFARSIGVSNVSVEQLEQLVATATTPPVVNQVQFSRYEYRKGLLEACRQYGIALEAYSPLGTGRHLSGDGVVRIAKQLCRSWAGGHAGPDHRLLRPQRRPLFRQGAVTEVAERSLRAQARRAPSTSFRAADSESAQFARSPCFKAAWTAPTGVGRGSGGYERR
jgi:aryl-alcohol dehydrogenase-like predicted oxidoreductase